MSEAATVLIVEDEAAVRRVVHRVLLAKGFRVLEAESGPSALEIAEGETIHLLLTDISLPGLGGPAVAKALLATRPEMKVIFTTGHPQDEAQRMVEGVEGSYLGKPYGLEDLLGVIDGALGRKTEDGRELRG